MNRFEYIVHSIEGDYAQLKRIDEESDALKLVARALLPPEIMEGSKLLYEYMEYQMME
ncbi:MAG: chorismate--pyruvate lyase [Eubacteriales bacterium]